VFPGLVKHEHAHTAIRSLHDSILWVHLELGPEATLHDAERKEIYALIDERENLERLQRGTATLVSCSHPEDEFAYKGPGAPAAPAAEQKQVSQLYGTKATREMTLGEMQRLAAVRARLKELIGAWKKTGYKYTSQVYHEIAMQNSDYGDVSLLSF
jgi:hypothetical protein